MSTINWDDMESAHEEANKPAPAGRYIVQVKSCKEGLSKKGDPQIALIWEIAEGPYKGKVAFDYLTFSKDKPNTISMARATLVMLGFPTLKDWGATAPDARVQLVIGRKIEADVSIDEYQGRVSNKLKQKIRPIAGGAGTGSEPSGLTPPPPAAAPNDPMAGAITPPVNPLAGI